MAYGFLLLRGMWGLSRLGIEPVSPELLGKFFTTEPPGKPCVLVTQSCLTLCDPMDCSPPGFSVHGDFPGKNTGVGCHFLLQGSPISVLIKLCRR